MSKLDLDPKIVSALAKTLRESGLAEIELREGDRVIRLTAPAPAPQIVQAVAPNAPAAIAPQPATAPQAPTAPEAPPAAPEPEIGEAVTSPMVGTAYLSPSPEAAPFVKAGDPVEKGQTLLIVEAMKVMNPIAAPRAGRVASVLVGDKQPVEFGEPLLRIE